MSMESGPNTRLPVVGFLFILNVALEFGLIVSNLFGPDTLIVTGLFYF